MTLQGFLETKHGAANMWLLLISFLMLATPAQAASSARADVSDLTLKIVDLDTTDGITANIEKYDLSTRGMSLYATNWDNYPAPTQATQTVNPSFAPGSLSIANTNADAQISIQGNVFSASGTSIETIAHAYAAPADAIALSTTVIATQDNLNPANGHLRVTPHTRIELSGQISFEGAITDTPYPFSQRASSVVLILFGRDGVTPVSFLKGVSVDLLPGGAPASSYSESTPFSLAYNNDSASYIDDLVLQFTVSSFAQTNEVSAVPEPSTGLLMLVSLFLVLIETLPNKVRSWVGKHHWRSQIGTS